MLRDAELYHDRDEKCFMLNDQHGKLPQTPKHKGFDLLKCIIIAAVILTLLFLLLAEDMKSKAWIEGKIFVVNDDFVISDSVECTYGYNGGTYWQYADRYVEVKCNRNPKGLQIKNLGYKWGCYSYRLSVSNGVITIHPIIHVIKEYHDLAQEWNIKFDFRKTDDRWDAVITSKAGNEEFTVECTDIERNGIELESWQEGGGIQKSDLENLREYPLSFNKNPEYVKELAVSVTNDSFTITDNVDCIGIYGMDEPVGRNVDVECERITGGMNCRYFDLYWGYRFSYTISGEGITVNPIINYGRNVGDADKRHEIEFYFYKTGDRWDAIVSFPDLPVGQMCFEDIVNNGICIDLN